MLTFAAAFFFLVVTPGPGVLSTAGVGASYGYRAGLAYVLGLFLGTNMVAAAVISGLAAIAFAYPPLKLVLTVASTAYLLYLAARIAFAGAKVGFIHPANAPGWKDGILLQAINPKAYAVNTWIFTGIAIGGLSATGEVIAKLVIANAIWIPIHLAWLAAGVAIRRMDLPARTQRRVNYAMAASMLVVVGLSVWKGLG